MFLQKPKTNVLAVKLVFRKTGENLSITEKVFVSTTSILY